MKIQLSRSLALAAFVCGVAVVGGCATHDTVDDWPAKVVSPDQLRPAEPFRLSMPRRNLSDPMPNGTTLLRLHVDERGIVRKTLIVSSSGNAVLDSAAQRAFVGAKFFPYQETGTAVAVTTLMPMSVKASTQCRGMRPLDC